VATIIADAYVTGLKAKWDETGDEESAQDFSLTHGATEADLARLRVAYPLCPGALIDLLRRVDGTYYRDYEGNEVSIYLLGSDVEGYPYYLLSAAEILESVTEPWSGETIRDTYGDKLAEWLPAGRGSEPGEGYLDDRIDPDLRRAKWLHFSDCMNNGGTSQLFIDFNTLGGGRVGQVVRFLHDPDSYAVIADGFEEYLQSLIDCGYAFVRGDDS
jgi:cell wall assembly regulator SMI1